MSDALVDRMRRAVAAAMPPGESVMLAVSGGLDSMVLLDAALAVRPDSIRVATFDHGSGPHAEAAVDLVERVALGAGVSVIIGRSMAVGRPSEASWRESRLGFLRNAAAEHRATLHTAHTRDDQVETVLFREMRGAGARGLAGLAATSDIRRPLLPFTRADVAHYAAERDVTWLDDPTNETTDYARNRLRLDILPALRRVTPTIDETLFEIGARAARWRADVDALIDRTVDVDVDASGRRLDVSVASLHGYAPEALAIVWPALLARIGVATDWRGTRRLAEFTTKGSTGGRIQLSGGWTVIRRRTRFEVRRHDGTTERPG